MAGVRFEETIEARLSGVSKRMRRTKSNLIREAVLDKLDDWEDLADAIEALENPGRTWSLDELEQGIDLKADALER
jgi:RHH-type transcriptional regulator, rel operon repressor / antitoxin RelB